MDYTDAIKYLKENNITKDDGSFYEFGEVIIFHNIILNCLISTLAYIKILFRTFLKCQSVR